MKPSGPVFDRTWARRCSIQRVSIGTVSELLTKHYLRKRPAVVPFAVAMFLDGSIAPLGCCVFALPPKQTSVRYGCETLELARLWIDDTIPANGETWLISKSVRLLRKALPTVGCLVSYADPSAGHAGTIYRAANWKADGRTDDERKTPRFDYVYQGRAVSRRGHIPVGASFERRPRISKARFFLRLKDQSR